MRSGLALLLVGCTGGTGPPLIDVDAWRTDLPSDPIPEHQPEDVHCDAQGWGEEIGGIEVETDLCPYAVLSQPLLDRVREGRSVHILAWHNDLVAPEPATGHMVLAINGVVIWDWEEPIPSRANVFDESVDVPASFETGATVTLHVHNHGANSWNLYSVEQ